MSMGMKDPEKRKERLTLVAFGRDLLGLEGVLIVTAVRARPILLGCTGKNGGAGEEGKDGQNGEEDGLHSV